MNKVQRAHSMVASALLELGHAILSVHGDMWCVPQAGSYVNSIYLGFCEDFTWQLKLITSLAIVDHLILSLLPPNPAVDMAMGKFCLVMAFSDQPPSWSFLGFSGQYSN